MKLEIVVPPSKINRSENRLNVVPLQRKMYASLWELHDCVLQKGSKKWENSSFTTLMIYQS